MNKIKLKNKTCSLFLISLMITIRIFAYFSDSFSKLITISTLFFIIIAIICNKKEYIILCIMSLLEFDSGTSPQNISIYLLSFAFIVDLILNFKKFESKKILFWGGWCTVFYISISLWNYMHSIDIATQYFWFDSKIYMSSFFSALIFYNLDIERFDRIVRILSSSYIIFVFIGYLLNWSSLVVESRSYVGYSVQLTFFLAYFTLFYFKFNRLKDFIYMLSLVLLMIITDNVISQNILILIVSILISFFISNEIKKNIFISLFICLISAIIFNNIDMESTRTFDKVTNITSLFSYTSLMDISHSPLVRIIEFSNIIYSIFNYNPFGSGFGGYFSEYIMTFPYLNKYDYSIDQINSGLFFNPHNFNYGLLKYGLMYILLFVVLFLKVSKLEFGNKKTIFIAILLFSSLNIGFTFIPSLLLGVVIANVNKSK
ncbi:hypothetical protein LZS94_10800 [Aliivibrio fischeri]|uniref:hypothetical protein n=1 Tax=Aliivibrio fischeri TaxID=668 RepID=UPI001F2BC7F3|nr:hypothetical protein [Aliivibrio fischeri]MCE7577986.1 hypothetical protein [Aliivibrio fischeri]MCE7590374.1 hypothetical protein [Aliivibrio fischeri]